MRQSADGHYVEVEGVRTFYLEEGSGPAVVLIHGAAPGASASLTWHLNIAPIAATGFRVVAYDQPGFGYSDDPTDDSTEFRVGHAGAFLDALRLERCALIGNSVGAYIAARLALDDERVEHLVLTASSVLAPRGSDEAQALAARHGAELRAFEPTLESVRELSLGTVYHSSLVSADFVETRFQNAKRHLDAHRRRGSAGPAKPILDRLTMLRQPTLILWGTDDHGAAVERALPMLCNIPNAELHIFRDCGHWVQWDYADRFNRLAADFLNSTPRPITSVQPGEGLSFGD